MMGEVLELPFHPSEVLEGVEVADDSMLFTLNTGERYLVMYGDHGQPVAITGYD